MDGWMSIPGAHVVGHRAVVRGDHGLTFASCTCGFESQRTGSLDNSCLALVGHLQASVRLGAALAFGDGGESGVREPRRPRPTPPGALSATVNFIRPARSA